VLGSAIVKYFCRLGCKVALLGLERARERSQKLLADIEGTSGEAEFFASDVLKEDLLRLSLEQILQRFGTIDVLINAAGGNLSPANVAPDQTVFDMDIDAMREVCDLNIFGTIIPTKVFLKPMAERGKGSIINFCSMSSFRPLTRVAGYGIAKAGIASWTQWLAGELASKFGEGLRVNAIAPGFVETEWQSTKPEHIRHSIYEKTAVKRFASVEEIADAVRFCINNAFVNGSIIEVSGGYCYK
jgi:NAD(P)-dependent dehydrogenase (short-subunit alcohol dehydrogenase family)